MSKQNYVLKKDEVVLCKESCVRHGFWSGYTDILIVTNQAVVLEKYGIFCNFKCIERYPYKTIKSAIIGKAANGEKQLELYLAEKREDFALQSGNEYSLENLLNTINDQLLLFKNCSSSEGMSLPSNNPIVYESKSADIIYPDTTSTSPNPNIALFCTQCGTKNRGGSKFCCACGNSLHVEDIPPSPPCNESTRIQQEVLRLQQMQLQLEMQKLNEARKQSTAQKRMADSQEKELNDKLKCPKCGSSALTSNKKGYGIGKGLVGAALFGTVGLAAGAIGSKKIVLTCMKCGHAFTPGKTFSEFLDSL
jgi:Zn finger protein HypA/HybF involved in hydrogenase expression